MADMLDALADARAALLGIPNAPPVLLPGDPDPDGDEVIVLDRVSDTGVQVYGGTASTKRLQVACYAATLARALELTTLTRRALRGRGFAFIQSRPTPDGVGELADYRRGSP